MKTKISSHTIDRTFNKISAQLFFKLDGENLNVKNFSLSLDTRNYQGEGLFVALKGEKYDALKSVLEAFKDPNQKQTYFPSEGEGARGLKLLVIEKSSLHLEELRDWLRLNFQEKKILNAFEVWVVSSGLNFLQHLSLYHQEHWKSAFPGALSVAISGSNGKTTTKEMLTHLLKAIYIKQHEVISTYKNNNNHLGVPLTLLDIDPEVTKVAVVECGSNHPGEMEQLLNYFNPEMGITTNIGETHLEFFQGLEAVFEEEAFIFEKILKTQGLFVLNLDDEYLKALLEKWLNHSKVLGHQKMKLIVFSKNELRDHQLIQSNLNNEFFEYWKISFLSPIDAHQNKYLQLEKINIKTQAIEEKISLTNESLLGDHNFTNLAHSYLLARAVLSKSWNQTSSNELLKKLKVAASNFSSGLMRSQWLVGPRNEKYFLDAYNANPSSMVLALNAFRDFIISKKISTGEVAIVLGQMNELGDHALLAHEELGAFAATLGFKHYFYVGDFAQALKKGFESNAHPQSTILEIFSSDPGEKEKLSKKLSAFQYIFLKASRSVALETLLPRELQLSLKSMH